MSLELNTITTSIEEAIEKLNTIVNSYTLNIVVSNKNAELKRLEESIFKRNCSEVSNKLEDLIPVIRKLLEDKTDLITELVNKAIDFDTKEI